jgi:hypothetical protein
MALLPHGVWLPGNKWSLIGSSQKEFQQNEFKQKEPQQKESSKVGKGAL